jgi:hypothetical protein
MHSYHNVAEMRHQKDACNFNSFPSSGEARVANSLNQPAKLRVRKARLHRPPNLLERDAPLAMSGISTLG